MRLVLDTNIVVSGLLWGGKPQRLIDIAVNEEFQAISSTPLLLELENVLHRRKFIRRMQNRLLTPQRLLTFYRSLVTLVEPTPIMPTVINDPDDDVVLATAIAAQADLVVSGDAHLLNLGSFEGIAIVSPAMGISQITDN